MNFTGRQVTGGRRGWGACPGAERGNDISLSLKQVGKEPRKGMFMCVSEVANTIVSARLFQLCLQMDRHNKANSTFWVGLKCVKTTSFGRRILPCFFFLS